MKKKQGMNQIASTNNRNQSIIAIIFLFSFHTNKH